MEAYPNLESEQCVENSWSKPAPYLSMGQDGIYRALSAFFGISDGGVLPGIEAGSLDVPEDKMIPQIQAMIVFNRWDDVVLLCDRFFNEVSVQESSCIYVQVCMYQCIALLEKKRYPEIEQIVSGVIYHLGSPDGRMNKLDTDYMFYVFMLEMIRAELPPVPPLNVCSSLYAIKSRISKKLSEIAPDSEEFQTRHVYLALIHVRLSEIALQENPTDKSFLMALSHLKQSLLYISGFPMQHKLSAFLSCLIGRVYFSLGMINQAAYCFETVQEVVSPSLALINTGLIKFGLEDYENSLKDFENAFELAVSFSDLTASVNNVCVALYLCGRISDAISFIEKIVKERPSVILKGSIAANLRSLYSLGLPHPEQSLKNLDYICQVYGNQVAERNSLFLS